MLFFCHVVDSIISSCNISLKVTGYDPSLSMDDVESKLCKHFAPASCFAYRTCGGLKRFFWLVLLLFFFMSYQLITNDFFYYYYYLQQSFRLSRWRRRCREGAGTQWTLCGRIEHCSYPGSAQKTDQVWLHSSTYVNFLFLIRF